MDYRDLPGHSFTLDSTHTHAMGEPPSIFLHSSMSGLARTLDELRQRVDALESEVERLKGGSNG